VAGDVFGDEAAATVAGMKQWAAACLLVKRINDGSVRCILVPLVVHADDEAAAIEQAKRILSIDTRGSGYTAKKWSVVEITKRDAICGGGNAFNIGAFTSIG
jgi:hypothetical protein